MPKPDQKWSQETLTLALEACKADGISLRKIAKTYGIPRATLHDKLTGRRPLEKGPNTVLTEEEEDDIVKWLREMSPQGFGCTKTDLFSTVKNYLDFKGRETRWPDNKPGEMWYRLFKKRHPDLTYRKPQKLGKGRVSPQMPKPKQKWSQETLFLALKACKVDGISMRKIAETYGIPRATLYDKLTGRRQLEQGPNTVLFEEEEDKLVKWLREMSSRGFGCTKKDLFSSVKSYLDFKGRETRWPDNKPGEMWYRLFKKRHPDLTFQKPQQLGKARALVTDEMLHTWFNKLQATISAIDPGIFLDPSRIFNADETWFHLDAQSGKILACIGNKFVYHVSQDKKTMITAFICASASGFFPHPLLIYPPTQFRDFSPTDIFPECLVAKSLNGWINSDLFADWLEKVFIPQTAHVKKPLLLLMDAYRSHQSMRTSELCSKNGIVLYALLAHASHVIHPLDVGVFSILKANWSETIRHREETNVLTKWSFANAFKDAYQKVVENKSTAYQAFRKSGIFPFDFHAIDKSKYFISTLESSPTTSSRTLPRLPPSMSVQLKLPTSSLPDQTSLPLPSQSLLQQTSLPLPSPSLLQPLPSFTAHSTSTSTGDSLQKLLMLTSQIGEQKTLLFLQRLNEGYDLTGVDKIYDLWKQYHLEVSIGMRSTDPTIIQKHPDPVIIPAINRGHKKRKTEKSPDVISAEMLNSKLKEKLAADKEQAKRKLCLRKELEGKKSRRLWGKKRKEAKNEREWKQELGMRKKESEARLQIEWRERNEKALEERKKKVKISKRKNQKETAVLDEEMRESVMVMESDSLFVYEVLEEDRAKEDDGESDISDNGNL